MSEAVKTLFTDISPSYDKLNHVLSFNFDHGWRRKSIGLINKDKDSDFTALDLCAGTYDFGLECLRQFPKSKIIAADFSFGMLDQGKVKIKDELAQGKIQPICADGLHLPLKDNSVDVIFCGYGYRNFDDTRQGLLESKRVLKPGGQLLVLEFFRPTKAIPSFFHKTYAQFIIPTLGKWVSGHDSAYHYLRDSIQGFMTHKEFEELLKAEGFTDVTCKNFIMAVSSVFQAKKV